MSLSKIQKNLVAPKNQRNNFGNYNYRSCEDILEAVKPLLSENEIILLNDEIISVNNRIYVKATATYTSGMQSISVSAFAREAESKKGMDEAQITGSASSYARKYALNGLLLCDDTKDADATNDHGNGPKTSTKKYMDKEIEQKISLCESLSELSMIQKSIVENKESFQNIDKIREIYTAKKIELQDEINKINAQ